MGIQNKNFFFTEKQATQEPNSLYLHPSKGTIAQLVEQRTENPCVPGSNPGSTTSEQGESSRMALAFFFAVLHHDGFEIFF